MNNQLIEQSENQIQQVNAGTTLTESKTAQEVQAAVFMAKKFPRDESACYTKIMQACKRNALAESAMYSYPRGGQQVTGASIRLAETLAQYWGNLEFGIVEVSQNKGVSEVMAYAWDLETNTRQVKQFNVKHSRYSKAGGLKSLTDPRDIYEKVANDGARRLRACILGVIPKDIEEAAIAQCENTLKGDNNEPLTDKIRRCVNQFVEIGVTQEMLERKLGHCIDATNYHELVSLGKVFNSIRDKMSSIQDNFPNDQAQELQSKVDKALKDNEPLFKE